MVVYCIGGFAIRTIDFCSSLLLCHSLAVVKIVSVNLDRYRDRYFPSLLIVSHTLATHTSPWLLGTNILQNWGQFGSHLGLFLFNSMSVENMNSPRMCSFNTHQFAIWHESLCTVSTRSVSRADLFCHFYIWGLSFVLCSYNWRAEILYTVFTLEIILWISHLMKGISALFYTLNNA